MTKQHLRIIHCNVIFYFYFFGHGNGRFYFLFPFIVVQLHACVVCIALLVGLAVVPTSGFYFVFVLFCFILEKKYALARRGIARDKLVFEMLKHDHVSFQILTRYF